MRNYKKLRLI
jgi:hypothetical protein